MSLRGDANLADHFGRDLGPGVPILFRGRMYWPDLERVEFMAETFPLASFRRGRFLTGWQDRRLWANCRSTVAHLPGFMERMEISYELAVNYASHIASGLHFDFFLSRELLEGHVFFGLRNVRPAERTDVLGVSVEPELFDHLALLESLAKKPTTGSAALANAIESTMEVLKQLRAPELVDQALLKKSLVCLGELERKLRKGWRKLRPFERLEQLKSVRHLWYGRFPNSDEACRHVYDRGRYWNPLCLELPEFKQFEDVPEISGLVWQQPGCPPLRVRTVDLENLGITETEVYACAGRDLRQLYTQARLRPINCHFQLEVGESMEGSFREVAGFWQDRKELVGVPVVAKVSS